MPRVKLTRALAQQTGNQLDHHVDAANVAAALDAVFAQFPLLRRYLLDDNGRIRQHVNIFINDVLIQDRQKLSDPVNEHDSIHVLQAVSGG